MLPDTDGPQMARAALLASRRGQTVSYAGGGSGVYAHRSAEPAVPLADEQAGLVRSISDAESIFECLRSSDGVTEWWSARDLRVPLGYTKWQNFEVAIKRAMDAAVNMHMDLTSHFTGASKVIKEGGADARSVTDYHLSRFAAYLVAMNGDPRKPEIAAAQSYFAAMTRMAEMAASRDKVAAAVTALSARDIGTLFLAEADRADRIAAENTSLQAKALVADRFLGASDDYEVREVCKLLLDAGVRITNRRLWKWLRDARWAYRSRDRYVATQYVVDKGWARMRAYQDAFYEDRAGQRHEAAPQFRVTPLGLQQMLVLLNVTQEDR